MKNKAMRILVVGLLMLLVPLCLIDVSYADDAEVLPKGVTRVRLITEYTLPVDERYDPDGKIEDVAVNFNVDLNSNVFPALGAFGAGATLGASIVTFEYQYDITKLAFEHGITDKLTVGIIIPYWRSRNDVLTIVDGATATVGKWVAGDTLAPCCGGGVVPLTTEDVQDLLGPGLDVAGDGDLEVAGFGYDKIESWSGSGIGDIEAGFRYQYKKTEDWRLAFTGGWRFPTGEIDDINSLVDFPGFSSGAHAVLLHSNNDYTGIENLVLNSTLRYSLVLPAKEELRVPSSVNLPITNNKEEVDRDLGDVFEFELSGTYTLKKGLSASLLYNYMTKARDEVNGNQGLAYDALEAETDATSHVYIVGLSYTTVPRYMEKTFPVPLTASVAYRKRFAGSNNAMNSQYVGLGLQVFF